EPAAETAVASLVSFGPASALPAAANGAPAPAGEGGADDDVPTVVVRRDDGDGDGDVDGAGPAFPAVARAAAPAPPPPPSPPSPALALALEKLRDVFKIRNLRPGQAEIMESVLGGRDTLAVMPTGS